MSNKQTHDLHSYGKLFSLFFKVNLGYKLIESNVYIAQKRLEGHKNG